MPEDIVRNYVPGTGDVLRNQSSQVVVFINVV